MEAGRDDDMTGEPGGVQLARFWTDWFGGCHDDATHSEMVSDRSISEDNASYEPIWRVVSGDPSTVPATLAWPESPPT